MEDVEDFVQAGQAGVAGGGDRDDVAAAVVGVGGAFDEVAGGEFVEDADHVAAVDAGAAAQVGLAGGAELVE
ncbi:hypothetical protein GCM10027589_21200 [Actinocorallia lasiicapitis]